MIPPENDHSKAIPKRPVPPLHTGRCTIVLMLVRKQIIVPSETDKRIRRLARQKGMLQSALIVEAVEAILETSTHVDRVLALAGMVNVAPPTLSDEVVVVVCRCGVRLVLLD